MERQFPKTFSETKTGFAPVRILVDRTGFKRVEPPHIHLKSLTGANAGFPSQAPSFKSMSLTQPPVRFSSEEDYNLVFRAVRPQESAK